MTYTEYIETFYETGLPEHIQKEVSDNYREICKNIIRKLSGDRLSGAQVAECVEEGLSDSLFEYGINPERDFVKLLSRNLATVVKLKMANVG